MIRVVALALWGVVLLQSSLSGRLDLLLRGVFHPLVALSGVLLLLLAALQLPRGGWRLRERLPWPWLLSSGMALAVLLLPPPLVVQPPLLSLLLLYFCCVVIQMK